jgi:hypothetical protein
VKRLHTPARGGVPGIVRVKHARGREPTTQASENGDRVNDDHPVRFAVDYPNRELNRLTTALRIFTVIPIAIVLATIGGYSGGGGFDGGSSGTTTTIAIGGTGLLFLPPLLMIVFRQKYPRWWFDWNLKWVSRDPALRRAVLPLHRRILRRHRGMVRDPVHGPLPARHLRLRRARDPLA